MTRLLLTSLELRIVLQSVLNLIDLDSPGFAIFRLQLSESIPAVICIEFIRLVVSYFNYVVTEQMKVRCKCGKNVATVRVYYDICVCTIYISRIAEKHFVFYYFIKSTQTCVIVYSHRCYISPVLTTDLYLFRNDIIKISNDQPYKLNTNNRRDRLT